MDTSVLKYAILLRDTHLLMHHSADTPRECLPDEQDEKLFAEAGTLLKMFRKQSIENQTMSTVQVLDYVDHKAIYENLYECPQDSWIKVDELLWPYVIAIKEPERRVRLVTDTAQCQLVNQLNPNDFINVSGAQFGLEDVVFDCIIRYIGIVTELHPVGYFFGLEITHTRCGYSPQSEDIPFSEKYTKKDPLHSIITTLDWIVVFSNEKKNKFSPLELMSGAIGKVVSSVIGPSSCTNGSYNTSSNKPTKKQKKREPSAQFYTPPVATAPEIDLYASQPFEAETPEFETSNEMERNTKAYEANHSVGDLYTIDTEKHMKDVKKHHASDCSAVAQSGHSQPPGILKKDKTDHSTRLQHSNKDRELVVIDDGFVQKSLENESKPIVVKNVLDKDVDLSALIGHIDWPKQAGHIGQILNTKAKNQTDKSTGSAAGAYGKNTDRNKSPNPLNHLGNASGTRGTAGTANIPPEKYTNLCYGDDEPFYDNLTNADNLEKVNGIPSYARSGSSAAASVTEPTSEFLTAEGRTLKEVPGTELGVGSLIDVLIPNAQNDLHGVIRWIGVPPGGDQILVGVELEESPSDNLKPTDGTYKGKRLFECQTKRAVFVSPENCCIDSRFDDSKGAVGGSAGEFHRDKQNDPNTFGRRECPSVPGSVPPLKINSLKKLEEICGDYKGIQGHHNSCYLDATLFAMFTFTSVFDSLLFRPPETEDISDYLNVQKVLREDIVNPLRKNVYVRADRVLKLRHLLDKLSSVSGLTSEEKDPEEFLNSLLAQIMRVEPFLKLSSGQDAFYYQLFVEKDERLCFPTVQQLFEQSFHSSDIKLKEVPSCLIIQMPRFGKEFKMYPRILPSQILDVTDIIEDSPRQCVLCGGLAECECRDCFGILQDGGGLENTAFCHACVDKFHKHPKRSNHSTRELSVPHDFKVMAKNTIVPRIFMELFAVVCIETSHYVAFVKAGPGPDAPWSFFDSMADRKGELNGYNIPKIVTVPELPQWLSEEGARTVNETTSNDKMLPEYAKRLFCDAYMCMYQSTDVMMYR